jgi:hypothetical protein
MRPEYRAGLGLEPHLIVPGDALQDAERPEADQLRAVSLARFLRDNGIQAVGVDHVRPGMQRMLGSMAIRVGTGLSGDARSAARAAG